MYKVNAMEAQSEMTQAAESPLRDNPDLQGSQEEKFSFARSRRNFGAVILAGATLAVGAWSLGENVTSDAYAQGVNTPPTAPLIVPSTAMPVNQLELEN